ncbi:MAG: outer membrane beta-barrel protein [Polaromonas sp.]
MMQKNWLCGLGAALLLAGSATWAADNAGLYVDVKLSANRQSIGDDQKVSPRQDALLTGSSAQNFTGAAISLGKKLGSDYRAEVEYTFPKSTEYTTFWTPFNANANVFQIRSQRLMLNGYKDFPLSSQWSANLMAGVGAASVNAQGWQGNPSRSLNEHSQTKLAFSLGAGAEYAMTPDWKLGFGYRYTRIGNIESGPNSYSTAAFNNVTGVGVQDEKMRGKLSENQLFVSLRKDF